MKAVAVLAVVLCAAVATVSAAAAEGTVAARFEKRRVRQSHVLANGARVECDRITGSCEECAKKQYVNGVLVAPCHWDHLTKSCNFNNREPWFCEGNVGYPTMECQRCEKRANDAKAAKEKASQAAAATAQAQAGAAKSAGKAGKFCQLQGGYKGICVTTTDRCTGGRPFARTGCMDPNMICCGLINKTQGSKDSKRDDKCSKFNGAKNCWSCLRAGCEMHIGTAACTHARSAFARAGDKNVVGSDAMCYLVGKQQTEARAKVKAKAAAKRNAGKKF